MQQPIRDSRGTEIEPGHIVAYNRSGEVIRGEVLRVSPSATWIMPDEEFRRRQADPRSRVRNPRSIMVLG